MAGLLRDNNGSRISSAARICLTTAALIGIIPSGATSAGKKAYSLQDAYESAFRNYETVRIAEEGLFQSEAVVDQAWTYLYPRLDGNAGYTRYNKILPPNAAPGGIFQPKDEITGSLVLTQPLYTGGRTLAALRSAKTLREASRQDLSAARQDLMLNVAEAFYGELKAQRIVGVSRDSVERMERSRAITEREANLRRNKANVSALLRANTLVSQARIILMRSEDGLRIAKRKLNLLTGLPDDADLAEPPALAAPGEGFDRLREEAFANREDYAKSRLNRDVAAENVTIVKGAHYPQVYAEGGLRYKDSDPKTLDAGTTYYGGLRLEVPIFEGGLMKHQVSEAQSKLRQSELASALLKRSIDDEVYESYLNYQTSTLILEAVRKQYDDARKNFDTVEALYADGLASTLQLIDAQQALLLSEQEYVNELYDQQVAILRLQRAMGLLGKSSS